MKIGEKVYFNRITPFKNLDEKKSFQWNCGKLIKNGIIHEIDNDCIIVEKNGIFGKYIYTLYNNDWDISFRLEI